MNQQSHRPYCIFQCNRCEHYRGDPEERPKDFALKWRIGWCNASGKEIPVMEDPQYTLINPVIPCIDWSRGKVRRIKPPTERKKRKKRSDYQGGTLKGF